jgi:anti-sigma factor RsiW
MNQTTPTHPSEDLLEKFARNRCNEEELEQVESHFLGCHTCVSRLEEIDSFLSAFKPGYQEFQADRRAKETKELKKKSRSWIFSPVWSLGMASAAVLAIGLVSLPSLHLNKPHKPASVAELQLSATRGNEVSEAPTAHPLLVHLNATDLPQTALSAEVVDSTGSTVWKGSTNVANDQATVSLPEMRAGSYFLRLYGAQAGQSDLLREFAFQIR